MLHAVIMAGGSGTRFWPESRDARPKQLLRLLGAQSMLRMTVDRLSGLVPAERILVATAERLVPAVTAELPESPRGAILGEPCKRDTAPCVGLTALLIARRDPDATMLVLPADHVIRPTEAFAQAVQFGAALIEESPSRLVTFGIRPTYAAETFGYIERGEPLADVSADNPQAYHVRQFREKPPLAVAQDYLAAGTFYWNAGIFLWKATTIIQELRTREKSMLERLERIADAYETAEFESVFAREFAAIQGKSIDYAVMEHARDVVVVEAPFAWDDAGSWQALERLTERDKDGNTLVGRQLAIDTTGTIVRTDDEHVVVTIGLHDTIVVHTPDATLVADKSQEEKVRRAVEALRKLGWTEYL
jgi:mannose-1-phosphate guanylyltransferase